ncbi:hypothetical protein [Hymenobacter chitinivorans]|uniref:Uncharacterized protein n=1 Tax=Hymenobacter chitinivorans DSM 11115 TaxID=1121954 RepID=A0A2M9BQR4_9BACT|nr:hypothetical protein [Hymenobacter chitinivorans]PJJ60296.1 hypothetical protein CLV45_1721 [Hymenobacter chitinivorans DSM 11115]
MRFTIGTRQFELQWFSDVSTRNGAGWELWECTGEKTLLIEIFRHDDLKKIDFATFEAVDIPLAAVDALLKTFNEEGSRSFVDESLWS